MHSIHYLVAFAAIAFAQDACTSGTYTNVNGLTCNTECSTDHSGGDYGAQYTGSFSGCVSACTSDANCQTAQYNRDNGYCYLKSAINPGSSSSNTDSITCQQPVSSSSTSTTTPATTPTPAPTPDPASCGVTKVYASGRSCKTSCSSDRAGGDYAAQYAATLQACADLCGQDSQCVTAQYHRDNQMCYLKNSANQLGSSTTTDTVDCSNPPVFYFYASNVALAIGRSQDANLYRSNGQYAQLVEYSDGYGDKLITFKAPASTTASAFYLDGTGRLISNATGYDMLVSTGYRASKVYISDPTQTFSGYGSPTCSISGSVLTCTSGTMASWSICFGGNNPDVGSAGANGVAYLTTLPSTQGNSCRTLTANVVYA